MKNTFLFLLALSLVFVSCKKDDDNPDNNDSDLSYDGEAVDAPALDAGTYELGARFPSSTTSNFTGKQLEEVSFYLFNVPSKTELIIYGEGTSTSPGTILYSANLTAVVDGNIWNTHTLSTPVDITGDDLWLCVQVEHNDRFGSLGCDTGPANSNGDWMLPAGTSSWTTLRNFSNNEVNINWNIRGKISE